MPLSWILTSIKLLLHCSLSGRRHLYPGPSFFFLPFQASRHFLISLEENWLFDPGLTYKNIILIFWHIWPLCQDNKIPLHCFFQSLSGTKTCLLFASASAKSNLASGWKHVVRESSELERWTNSRLQEKDWHRITSGHIPLPLLLLCVSHVHIKIQLLSDQAPVRSAKQHHSLLLFSCKHFPTVGYTITPSKCQNNNNIKEKVLAAHEVVLLDWLFFLNIPRPHGLRISAHRVVAHGSEMHLLLCSVWLQYLTIFSLNMFYYQMRSGSVTRNPDCRVQEPLPPRHCHFGVLKQSTVSTVIETPALMKPSAKSN